LISDQTTAAIWVHLRGASKTAAVSRTSPGSQATSRLWVWPSMDTVGLGLLSS